MYKVSSIKILNGNYEFNFCKELSDDNTESLSLRSKDKPRPELINSLVEVKELLFETFNLFKFGAKMVNVYAIRFKYGGKGYDKDEISGYKIYGLAINKKQDYCRLETEMLKMPYESNELEHKIISRLIDEAILYIKGKRAQSSLFNSDLLEKVEFKTSEADTIDDFLPADAVDRQGAVQ